MLVFEPSTYVENLTNVIQESSPTNMSSGRDPSIIEGGLMMRLRVKRVKQAMGLVVQSIIDERSFVVQDGATLMLGRESK